MRKRRDAILLHEDLQFGLSVDTPRFGAGLRQGFLGARVIAYDNCFADALREHFNPSDSLCLQQRQQLRFMRLELLPELSRAKPLGLEPELAIVLCPKRQTQVVGFREYIERRHSSPSSSGCQSFSNSAVAANSRFIASRSRASPAQGGTPEHSLVDGSFLGWNIPSGCSIPEVGISPGVVPVFRSG